MRRPSWEWFWSLVDRFRDQVAEWRKDFTAVWEEMDRNPDLAMKHERNDLD